MCITVREKAKGTIIGLMEVAVTPATSTISIGSNQSAGLSTHISLVRCLAFPESCLYTLLVHTRQLVAIPQSFLFPQPSSLFGILGFGS